MMLKTIANLAALIVHNRAQLSPQTNAAIGQRVRDRSNDRLKSSAAPSAPHLLCMSCFSVGSGERMTDTNTLLQSAARCRRMAERCANEAIAKKFEALANDYEEHARRAAKGPFIVELSGAGGAKAQTKSEAPDVIEPSTSAAPSARAPSQQDRVP
jgi:hypothetical protein